MKKEKNVSRRMLVKSSVFGLLAASVPQVAFCREIVGFGGGRRRSGYPSKRFPAIEDEIVSEVVGVSHFNLDRLKELVDPRPELARATWDWRFGDWESAIGAAAHVGRKDIMEYLLSKGARPNIFTFAALGAYATVKSMIDFQPGIQRIMGPHGISLLQHAKNGLRDKGGHTRQARKLVGFLESLGDADGEQYLEVEEPEKEKYLGDYKYGEGEKDGFTISLNMRGLLSLGELGSSGGALYRIGENRFTYNGAPSVEITFEVKEGNVHSLTVHEPQLTLTAKKQ